MSRRATLLRGDVVEPAPGGGVLGDPARLRAVARLALGARAEPAFDRIAVLVERLVDVPVALVTVVEAERQLLPGQVGLPEQVAARREMALSHSFSRHVVEAGEPLVVADVRADPRLRDNLAIRDFGAASFAGVPLTDSDGLVLGTLAVMDREARRWTDSEIRLLAELGEVCSSELRLRIAREIADEARRAAESAHEQLALLGELTEAMAGTMDVDEALGRLGRRVADRLADWSVVMLTDPGGRIRHVSAAHRSPACTPDAERLAALGRGTPPALKGLVLAVQRSGRLVRGTVTPGRAGGGAGLPFVDGGTRSGGTVTRRTTGGDPTTACTTSGLAPTTGTTTTGTPGAHATATTGAVAAEVAMLAERMGLGAYLIAPITAPATGRIMGAVLLVNGPGRAAFTAAEERTAVEIGRRAGLAVDNSRLYAHQRHFAEVLQHSMLPALPDIAGIDLYASYLPAQAGAAVGGDWYDAFAQPDGSLMLAVGDVAGHDIEAAATMGQVRNLVRGDAYGRGDLPGPLLARLDRALHGLRVPAAATAVLARVHRDGDGYRVSFANAGHPPPLLLRPDGEVEVWWVPPEPLLGLVPRDDRTTHHRWVPAGSTLLLYTDGLVEHPARLIDRGITRVCELLRSTSPGVPADELCTRLIDATPRRADDIALLVMRLREDDEPAPP